MTALKLSLVTALLYFLGKKGFLSIEATGRAFSRLDRIVPAFLILCVCALLTVIRWQWLLQAQGIQMRWMRTLQLAFVGMFFNIALPGAVSGDLVKAFYIGKEVEGQRARAFGSILFDRVAGLSALVLVSAGALFMDFQALVGTALMRGIQMLVIVAAVSVVLFYAYLFLVKEHHDPLLHLFRALEKRFKVFGSFARIYEGIRHYHNCRWTVIKVLGISAILHVLVCTACLLLLHAIGDEGVPAFPVFVVVPLGLLVTAVPIMPAGIGTGHAAFSWLFHYLGSQRGADVFSLYALVQLVLGGLGGLVYLRFKSREPQAALDTEAYATEA